MVRSMAVGKLVRGPLQEDWGSQTYIRAHKLSVAGFRDMALAECKVDKLISVIFCTLLVRRLPVRSKVFSLDHQVSERACDRYSYWRQKPDAR